MAKYKRNSPYYSTTSTNNYLALMTYRNIPYQVDDILFTITNEYEHRPDLLAYDLYKDAGLWWVFIVRNISIIEDPIFDFVAGKQIYLPKLSTIKDTLGI